MISREEAQKAQNHKTLCHCKKKSRNSNKIFAAKERSAASRNQFPLFPRRAQSRRERGEKILAKLRDSDRLQSKEHRDKNLWSFPLCQGNVCQGNGRGPRLDYSPDNHSPDFSPALPILRWSSPCSFWLRLAGAGHFALFRGHFIVSNSAASLVTCLLGTRYDMGFAPRPEFAAPHGSSEWLPVGGLQRFRL
jgi:hypothetical protein